MVRSLAGLLNELLGPPNAPCTDPACTSCAIDRLMGAPAPVRDTGETWAIFECRDGKWKQEDMPTFGSKVDAEERGKALDALCRDNNIGPLPVWEARRVDAAATAPTPEVKATPAAEVAPDKADAKPKKTRAKKAKPEVDAFEPKGGGVDVYKLYREPFVTDEIRAALKGPNMSSRNAARVLLRIKSGETLSQALGAEEELQITAAEKLIGEDQWTLLEDEFGVKNALRVVRTVKHHGTLEAAVKAQRAREKGKTSPDDDSIPFGDDDEASEGA